MLMRGRRGRLASWEEDSESAAVTWGGGRGRAGRLGARRSTPLTFLHTDRSLGALRSCPLSERPLGLPPIHHSVSSPPSCLFLALSPPGTLLHVYGQLFSPLSCMPHGDRHLVLFTIFARIKSQPCQFIPDLSLFF